MDEGLTGLRHIASQLSRYAWCVHLPFAIISIYVFCFLRVIHCADHDGGRPASREIQGPLFTCITILSNMSSLFLLHVVVFIGCCCIAAVAFPIATSLRPRLIGSSSKLQQASKARNSKQAKSKKGKGKESSQIVLESCLEASLDKKDVLLVVDANNVRGKSDFKMTNRDLLIQLKSWRKSRFPNINIICVVDHGSLPALFSYDGLGLVEFAGPNRTADDVIAQSARWFSNTSMGEASSDYEEENKDCDVFIVTSDGGLRQRCLAANRPGNFKRKRKMKQNVKSFTSFQLLASLERIQEMEDNRSHKLQFTLEEKLFQVESDIRLYERQQPPWPSRQAKLDAMATGPWRECSCSIRRCV